MTFLTRDRLGIIAGGAVALAITAGAYMMMTRTADAATIGEQAPAFEELNTAGKAVKLSDFAGKTVVIEWTNDGCPYVQKHYNSKNMQKTQEAATKDGVVWLTVISSKPGSQGYVSGAQADQLTTSRGAHPTQVLLDPDGSMGRAYGAKTTPHIFVITPQGKLAYQGAIDSIQSTETDDIPKATNYVKVALAAVKAGKTPDPSVTKAYGCSVKY